VVVTLNSLQGHSIDEYGYQLGRHWGIGQKGRNNGVLLIVASIEHKVRIEACYGLEGTFTDALSSNIIDTVITPRFRKGDMAGDTPATAPRGVVTMTFIADSDKQRIAEAIRQAAKGS
jgi:uncharacterized protein